MDHPENLASDEPEFDWTKARWGLLYPDPASDIFAEAVGTTFHVVVTALRGTTRR